MGAEDGVLIINSEDSSWTSCRSIRKNLAACYLNSSRPYKIFKRFGGRPSEIVFLEHGPPMLETLKRLARDYKKARPSQRPVLTFHIYGDFMLHLHTWIQASPYLKQFPVRLLAASPAQKSVIDYFLHEDCASEVFPFPVDTAFYRPSGSGMRKELGLTKEDFVFLYAGRMSRQKEVLNLMASFSNVCEKKLKAGERAPCLLLAGPFDDLGTPYLGSHDHKNGFFTEFVLLWQSLKMREHIKYIGAFGAEDLVKVYNSADCFVSVSLHHDEDYGMAPLEAMASGLPAILSAWGGYTSFGAGGPDVRLVPAQLAPQGPRLDLKRLEKELFSAQRPSPSQRKKQAALVDRKFSIRALSSTLPSTPPRPFKGLHARGLKFGAPGKGTGRFPVLSRGHKFMRIYQDIYAGYA